MEKTNLTAAIFMLLSALVIFILGTNLAFGYIWYDPQTLSCGATTPGQGCACGNDKNVKCQYSCSSDRGSISAKAGIGCNMESCCAGICWNYQWFFGNPVIYAQCTSTQYCTGTLPSTWMDSSTDYWCQECGTCKQRGAQFCVNSPSGTSCGTNLFCNGAGICAGKPTTNATMINILGKLLIQVQDNGNRCAVDSINGDWIGIYTSANGACAHVACSSNFAGATTAMATNKAVVRSGATSYEYLCGKNYDSAWTNENITVDLTAIDASPTNPGIAWIKYCTTSVVCDPAAGTLFTAGTPFTIGDVAIKKVCFQSQNIIGNLGDNQCKNINIDKTAPAAPTITSTSHPLQTNWYSSNAPVLSWSSSDGVSGIAGYYFTLDQTPTTTPSTTGTIAQLLSTSYSGKASGTWYFHVLAKDNAGNLGSVTTYTVNIDVADPTTSDNAPTGWQKNDVIVTITPSDVGSNVAWTRYCSGTSMSSTPNDCGLTSGFAYTEVLGTSAFSLPVFGEGYTKLCYQSQDNVGRLQAKICKTVQIDKHKPYLYVNPNGNTDWTKELTISTLECKDDLSGCKEFDNWLICAFSSPGSSYTRITSIGGTSVSNYRITSKASSQYSYVDCILEDIAGNLNSSAKSKYFKYDNAEPSTSINLDMPNKKFTLSYNDGSDDGSGIGVQSTKYSVIPYANSCPAFASLASVYSGEATLTSCGAAECKVCYASSDLLGNTEPTTESQKLIFDNTLPTTLITPNGGSWTNDNSFTLTCNDAGGCQKIEYKIISKTSSCDAAGLTPYNCPVSGSCTTTITIPCTNTCENKICFRSIDTTNNIELINTSNIFQIYLVSPVIDIKPNGYGWTNKNITFNITCSDSFGCEIMNYSYYNFTSKAWLPAITVNNQNASNNFTCASGAVCRTNISITAKSNLGNINTTISREFMIDLQNPLFMETKCQYWSGGWGRLPSPCPSPTLGSITAGNPVLFTAKANDAGSGIKNVTIHVKNSTGELPIKTASGNPILIVINQTSFKVAGEYDYWFTAEDNAGNLIDSEIKSFRVGGDSNKGCLAQGGKQICKENQRCSQYEISPTNDTRIGYTVCCSGDCINETTLAACKDQKGTVYNPSVQTCDGNITVAKDTINPNKCCKGTITAQGFSFGWYDAVGNLISGASKGDRVRCTALTSSLSQVNLNVTLGSKLVNNSLITPSSGRAEIPLTMRDVGTYKCSVNQGSNTGSADLKVLEMPTRVKYTELPGFSLISWIISCLLISVYYAYKIKTKSKLDMPEFDNSGHAENRNIFFGLLSNKAGCQSCT